MFLNVEPCRTVPAIDEEVQIARIDTAHGYVHIDRLYGRDRPKEKLDLDFWDAVEDAEERWRTFAEGYDRHGGEN